MNSQNNKPDQPSAPTFAPEEDKPYTVTPEDREAEAKAFMSHFAPSVPAAAEVWEVLNDCIISLESSAEVTYNRGDKKQYMELAARVRALAPYLAPAQGADRQKAFEKLEQDLWALRQRVLGMGMGDPWDGEELENGYVRPIPAGFEDEVAKFDKMHSQQIKESNECLEVISELAMRCRTLAEAAPQPTGKQAEGVTDTERLNALINNKWTVQYNSRIDRWTVQRFDQVVGCVAQGNDTRAAIDTALRSSNQTGEGRG